MSKRSDNKKRFRSAQAGCCVTAKRAYAEGYSDGRGFHRAELADTNFCTGGVVAAGVARFYDLGFAAGYAVPQDEGEAYEEKVAERRAAFAGGVR